MNAVTDGGVPTYFSTSTSAVFDGFPSASRELGVSMVTILTLPWRSSDPACPGFSGSYHRPFPQDRNAAAGPRRHDGAGQRLPAIVEDTHDVPVRDPAGGGVRGLSQIGSPLSDLVVAPQRGLVQLRVQPFLGMRRQQVQREAAPRCGLPSHSAGGTHAGCGGTSSYLNDAIFAE